MKRLGHALIVLLLAVGLVGCQSQQFVDVLAHSPGDTGKQEVPASGPLQLMIRRADGSTDQVRQIDLKAACPIAVGFESTPAGLCAYAGDTRIALTDTQARYVWQEFREAPTPAAKAIGDVVLFIICIPAFAVMLMVAGVFGLLGLDFVVG